MRNPPLFELRPLPAALAALFLGVTLPSHAVHLSTHGEGQVLLFPYYTVRGNFATLVTVVNTHESYKALKVRFLEGRNSREVLSFNLFMPPNDVWVGAVVPTATGARLVTNDNSCTIPNDLFTETRTTAQGLAPNEFSNFNYSGAQADTSGTAFSGLDRTREGFFEIIEMGVVNPAESFSARDIVDHLKPRVTGTPTNCAALVAFEPGPSNTNRFQFPNIGEPILAAPKGGLYGRASLLDASTGANYTYKATALESWSDTVRYTAAGDAGPALADASPVNSLVTTPDGIVASKWRSGADAVTAALMRYEIKNEFVLDSGTASQTDWIVAFPTKRYYVQVGTGAVKPPFAGNFSPTNASSCDGYMPRVFNREAQPPPVPTLPVGVRTSDPPPLSGTYCHGTQVIPFSASTPLRAFLIDVPQGVFGQFASGIYTTQFSGATASLTPISATLTTAAGITSTITGRTYGLPAIGFMLHNYRNAGVGSQYGGVIEHSYTSRIE